VNGMEISVDRGETTWDCKTGIVSKNINHTFPLEVYIIDYQVVPS